MGTDTPFIIVEVLYPGMTQLDFTGPHTVFNFLPDTKVIIASEAGGPIESEGLVFAGTTRLADIDRCDLLFLPGGLGTMDVINDPAFMAQIRRLATGARYLTSVCTGSIILGAAGLLKGKRAASHWGFREMLSLFGAIPDPARVVRDGNIFTAGGVTAGIDFGLTIAAELVDDIHAQQIQLSIEYAPAPPFESGRPETAPAEVMSRVESFLGPIMPANWEKARAAADRLAAA